MRVEAIILVGVGFFFAITDVVYWVWGVSQKTPEPGGTMILVGTIALGLIPGAYYMWWSRRMKPRPEDRNDATLQDGAGVIGSFPASSIWPFVMRSNSGRNSSACNGLKYVLCATSRCATPRVA